MEIKNAFSPIKSLNNKRNYSCIDYTYLTGCYERSKTSMTRNPSHLLVKVPRAKKEKTPTKKTTCLSSKKTPLPVTSRLSHFIPKKPKFYYPKVNSNNTTYSTLGKKLPQKAQNVSCITLPVPVPKTLRQTKTIQKRISVLPSGFRLRRSKSPVDNKRKLKFVEDQKTATS